MFVTEFSATLSKLVTGDNLELELNFQPKKSSMRIKDRLFAINAAKSSTFNSNIFSNPTVMPITSPPLLNSTYLSSYAPSSLPSEVPTSSPTQLPTNLPSQLPTNLPSLLPTSVFSQNITFFASQVLSNLFCRLYILLTS